MTCYDPEALIEHIRATSRDFGSIGVSVHGITIDWRSWRLLAQHINRSAMHADRYTNIERIQIDGIEIMWAGDQEPEDVTCYDPPALPKPKKKALSTSTSTVPKLKHE